MDKLCNHCKETKPTAEFHKDKSKRDGFNAYCKPCTIERQRTFFARPPKVKAPEGFKKCQTCKKVLEVGEFFKTIGSHDGYAKKCKSCSYKSHDTWRRENLAHCAKDQKQRRQADPERFKDYWRKQHYGLEPGEFDFLLADQGGKCAICKSDASKGRLSSLHVDHCHTTGVVRGLLCNNCNHGLGKFGDSVEVLMEAVKYLQKERGL